MFADHCSALFPTSAGPHLNNLLSKMAVGGMLVRFDAICVVLLLSVRSDTKINKIPWHIQQFVLQNNVKTFKILQHIIKL